MPDTSERMAQSGGQHSGKIHQSPMCSVSFATKAGVCSSPKLELQKLSISKRSLYAACKSGQMFYITAHGSKRQKANVAKLSLKFQPEQSHFCHILLSIARQREPRFQGNATTQRTEQLKGWSSTNSLQAEMEHNLGSGAPWHRDAAACGFKASTSNRCTSPSPFITNSYVPLQGLKGTIQAALSSFTPLIHRTLVEIISNCRSRLRLM